VKVVGLAGARRLALHKQRLAGPRRGRGAAAVLKTVRELGYVQLDPTNVVARSHLLVLRARVPSFRPVDVERLLADRSLFEYSAFILPVEDLPLHARTMALHRRPSGGRALRVATWVKANAALRRHILSRLRRDEVLPTSAFEDRATIGWRSTGWTAGKNVSQMLEFLWRQGVITVAERSGGERRWTIARSWLPHTRMLSATESERYATERAVRAFGIATLRDLRSHYAYWRFVTPGALDWLERHGRLAHVQVEGSREPWYVHAEDVPLLARLERDPGEIRTTLLSPFDNLIIDRRRTERLFGFRYRMEIYIPPTLRRFGYFAMPILHGDRIVGTVDPRLSRETGRLRILSTHLTPDRPRVPAPALRDAVAELAAFVGARDVEWPHRRYS